MIDVEIFTIKNFVDLLIVGALLFKLGLIIKSSRALNIFLGLIILTILFSLAGFWNLYLTKKLLSYFFDHLILIIVVLFQEEIRNTLASVGRRVSSFYQKRPSSVEEVAETLSEVCFQLSIEKTGGLIVLERDDKLNNIMETGTPIFSKVRPEIIYSFFQKTSPLHDGAIIVSNGEIISAGSLLPLSKSPTLNKNYGTRHRAAIGLSEETDALILVVSEETGDVSIASKGNITKNLKKEELRALLIIMQEKEVTKNQMIDKIILKIKDYLKK